MKGLLHSFDPGASWVTPALPGLRNAGPLDFAFVSSNIYSFSGSCAYSVLAKKQPEAKDQISKTEKRSMHQR